MKAGGSFEVSDELLGTVAPIVVYWVYSGIYVFLGSLDNYRLHSRKDEDEKNLVSKSTVFKGVLLQQAVQAIVALILFAVPLSLSGFAYFDLSMAVLKFRFCFKILPFFCADIYVELVEFACNRMLWSSGVFLLSE